MPGSLLVFENTNAGMTEKDSDIMGTAFEGEQPRDKSSHSLCIQM